MRTLGRVREWNRKYMAAGSPLKRAQEYKNCIHTPIIDGQDEEFILLLIPPAELHLMLGAVNTLLTCIEDRGVDIKSWLLSNLNIKHKPYHGTCLEGRDGT